MTIPCFAKSGFVCQGEGARRRETNAFVRRKALSTDSLQPPRRRVRPINSFMQLTSSSAMIYLHSGDIPDSPLPSSLINIRVANEGLTQPAGLPLSMAPCSRHEGRFEQLGN